MNDRQFYLPSAGILLLVSVWLVESCERLAFQKIFVPSLIVITAMLLTWMRNWDYRTEVTLWNASLQVNSDNARAWNNLGYAYTIDGENDKAKAAFEYALKLNPGNFRAYFNLRGLENKSKPAKQ